MVTEPSVQLLADWHQCAGIGRWLYICNRSAWTQPLGFRHALFEVVADVVGRAADMEDPAAIVAAIEGTSMKTIVGTVDWSKGPVKNVSKTPLVAGQWQKSGGALDLVITSNDHAPEIPVGGELALLS